jgi:hypothetical protein
LNHRSIPVFGWGSPDKTGTSFFVGREYSRHETPEERNGKKEEMIAQGKKSRLQRESNREPVPRKSLELIILYWMQYLRQHKFYDINGLRDCPSIICI